MKIRLSSLVVGLCLIGVVSLPAYADPQGNNAAPNEQQLIDNLTAQTAALQKQVTALQVELKQIKRSGVQPHAVQVVHVRTVIVHEVPGHASYATVAGGPGVPVELISNAPAAQNPLIKRPVGGSPSPSPVQGPVIRPFSLLASAPLIFGGMPVVTSPYLGERSEFDASDLISFLPFINEDLHLLTERQKIEDVFKSYCEPVPDEPFLDLSGELQATGMYAKEFDGQNNSGFDLPTAELFAMGGINSWTTAFMGIAYDNTPPEDLTPPTFGPVFANSRVFLDQGFITIGNINDFPVYGSIGQLYVPFGTYATYQVSNPLTEALGRTKARAVVLGFDEPGTYYGLDIQAFVFRGFSGVSEDDTQVINNGGANFDYTWNKDIWNGDLGASYIINIADSINMQQNGADSGFAGFGGDIPAEDTEILEHRVPAVDFHATFGVGNFSLIGEYITATSEFSEEDLTFNNHGADPKAGQLEAVYTFHIEDKPANIALGYQQTSDALALLVPWRRYTATFNINLLKDTLESIEFRHDINYAASDFATGQGEDITTDGLGLGHSSNTVTGELTVYF